MGESKAYQNCLKIYKRLSLNYTEDVPIEDTNPIEYKRDYLSFPEKAFKVAIGREIGIDTRTIKLYEDWMMLFGMVKRVNPHAYRLVPLEDNHQKTLDLEE